MFLPIVLVSITLVFIIIHLALALFLCSLMISWSHIDCFPRLRDTFRIMLNIYDKTFCKSDSRCFAPATPATSFRSNHRRCSLKKGVQKNFAKFTWKYLCQSLFFNKVTGLKPATLLKKRRLWHKFFPFEFCEIFKKKFFTEHLHTTAFVHSLSIHYIVVFCFRN